MEIPRRNQTFRTATRSFITWPSPVQVTGIACLHASWSNVKHARQGFRRGNLRLVVQLEADFRSLHEMAQKGNYGYDVRGICLPQTGSDRLPTGRELGEDVQHHTESLI